MLLSPEAEFFKLKNYFLHEHRGNYCILACTQRLDLLPMTRLSFSRRVNSAWLLDSQIGMVGLTQLICQPIFVHFVHY